MKAGKKRTALFVSVIVFLFVTPLIVFATMYYSGKRENDFAPGSVDIAVKEGDVSSDELKKDYVFTKTGTVYTAEKLVQVKDVRKYPGEKLRVCFIPMWYEKDDEGNAAEIAGSLFNFTDISLHENTNTLIFSDSGDPDNVKTITLKLNSGWKTNGWSYGADGCFYYEGTLQSGALTAKLLDSVELNEAAYALTEEHIFRLDVLADAVQATDDADDKRGWK